jgi:hypothetical protein
MPKKQIPEFETEFVCVSNLEEVVVDGFQRGFEAGYGAARRVVGAYIQTWLRQHGGVSPVHAAGALLGFMDINKEAVKKEVGIPKFFVASDLVEAASRENNR